MKCKIFHYLIIDEVNINAWLKTEPYIVIEKVIQIAKGDGSPEMIIFYSNRKDKLNAINLLVDSEQ